MAFLVAFALYADESEVFNSDLTPFIHFLLILCIIN